MPATCARSGFTVMNMANNHSYDFGASGQAQTLAALRRAGLRQDGLAGEITTLRVHGVRVAVIGFAPYSWANNLLDIPRAKALVRRARRRAQVVIVVIHAGAEGVAHDHVPHGTEYDFGENRGNSRAFAHAVIDAGATIVVGSGPHVLRGIERYRGHMIAYSLGNFACWHDLGLGGLLSESAILHVTHQRRHRPRGERPPASRSASSARDCRGPIAPAEPIASWPRCRARTSAGTATGSRPAARSAPDPTPAQELAERRVGLLRSLDLRHVAAVELEMAGARQRLGHVALEGDRHEPVAAAPHEQGVGLQRSQARPEALGTARLVEADLARRGVERRPTGR